MKKFYSLLATALVATASFAQVKVASIESAAATTLEEGKYYLMYNTSRQHYTFTALNNVALASRNYTPATDETTSYYVWTVEKVGENVKFKNAATGTYLPVVSGTNNGGNITTVAASADAGTFTVTADAANSTFTFESAENAGTFLNGNPDALTTWSDAHAYQFTEVTLSGSTATLPTVSEIGAATSVLEEGKTYLLYNTSRQNYAYNLAVNAAVLATQSYTPSTETPVAYLWQVENDGTNVKIKNVFTGAYLPAVSTTNNGSALVSSTTAGVFTPTASGDTFTFESADNASVFLNGNAGNVTTWTEAHAYQLIELVTASTSIQGAKFADETETTYFDLSGRKVSKLVSGKIYITNKGKKVFVK